MTQLNCQTPEQIDAATRWALRCVLLLAFSMLAWLSPSLANAQNAAGQIMFVAGNAHKQGPSGKQQALTKDMVVTQGDKLVTQANAYVYTRMADGALLVLRPDTTLSIDLWRYNAEKPEQSQIKYTLHTGLSRYVSGRGSQAAKDQFRFNTPLAAIGVRGTDFTVLAQPGVTEVAVRSGGVVVSGFGDSCKAESLGPCEGRSAAELFAGPTAGFLQLRAGEQRPQLIPVNGKTGPDATRPALPSEPLAKEGGSNNNQVLLANAENRAEKATSQWAVLPEPQAPPAPAPAPAPPPAPLAAWGRWGGLATAEQGQQVVAALLAGREIAAINPHYVLAKNPGVFSQVPETGVGHFQLIEHNGLVRNPQTQQFENTQSTGGTLSIDFGQQRFQTTLQLQALGQTTQISATGKVEPGGVLRSDLFVSPMVVQGLVGGAGAGQAAYIYRQSVGNGPELSGATQWSR